MITLFAMPEDRHKADVIVDAMVTADLDVWGETATPGNSDWSEALVRFEKTRCAAVCWSEAALADTVEARLFRKAALQGCAQGKTIGVLLDKVAPPEGFNCTTYNLAEWRISPTGWRKLLVGNSYLRDLVEAARFKQANRDPPPPSAPRKLFLRQAAVLSSAVIVPMVAVASFTDVLLNFEQRLARQPSVEEQAAWNALPPGNCDALRTFVIQFDDGALRDRADALLGARQLSQRTDWQAQVIEEEIYLAHSAGTREKDAIYEGERRCKMIVQGTGARDLEVSTSQLRQDCENVGSEQLCDWRGTATCSFEEPRLVDIETCNIGRD